MILVDTSVWVDHLRNTNKKLITLLLNEHVLIHDLVIGELACGNLSKRAETLGYLHKLPQVEEVTHSEVLKLIESRHLFGKGIGYIDGHLLASALVGGCQLWSLDKRLMEMARKMGAVFSK